MRETTAEMWIGPNQSSSWAGTQGGLNATHLLLLRENSRPSWLLLPGNLHDSKPPVVGPAKVWVPTPVRPVQDALLLFALMGAKVAAVLEVFKGYDKTRNRSRFDLVEKFPRGLAEEIYTACQLHLNDWHVVLSVGKNSLANQDLNQLDRYRGLNVEIRTPR